MSTTDQQRDELVERLFAASLGMAEILTVYLGDTLGLYRALDRSGPMTAPELAREAGIFPQYAREWLEQQAAAGILTVDDASAGHDERRYVLAAGHAEPLLHPESPYSIAPLCKSFVAVSGVMPELVTAFRSGGHIPWWAYGRDMVEAQGDFNRPWLVGSFATEYLPSVPDVHMDDPTSAATGTVMRRRTFEGYARAAGFNGVSVLPIEHDFLRFYRLDR